MSEIEFQSILFRTIFSAMICDGEIHPDELTIFLKFIRDNPSFIGFNYKNELEKSIIEVETDINRYLEEVLSLLKNYPLNQNQKILIVEVVLKMISTDNKIDQNEITFLSKIISLFKFDEVILFTKFPSYLNILTKINMNNLSKVDINIFSIKGIENIKKVN